jgi:hypothetical protein
MRLFLGGVMLVLGVVLAVGGGRTLSRAWTSGRWPEVEGRVLASSVETVGDSRAARYKPTLRYSYAVGGHLYVSDVLSFGAGARETEVRKEAEAYLKRYPEGAVVRLRYAPEEPGLACVECGSAGPADYVVAVGGLGMALFAGTGLVDLLRVRAQKRRLESPPPVASAGGTPGRSG